MDFARRPRPARQANKRVPAFRPFALRPRGSRALSNAVSLLAARARRRRRRTKRLSKGPVRVRFRLLGRKRSAKQFSKSCVARSLGSKGHFRRVLTPLVQKSRVLMSRVRKLRDSTHLIQTSRGLRRLVRLTHRWRRLAVRLRKPRRLPIIVLKKSIRHSRHRVATSRPKQRRRGLASPLAIRRSTPRSAAACPDTG